MERKKITVYPAYREAIFQRYGKEVTLRITQRMGECGNTFFHLDAITESGTIMCFQSDTLEELLQIFQEVLPLSELHGWQSEIFGKMLCLEKKACPEKKEKEPEKPLIFSREGNRAAKIGRECRCACGKVFKKKTAHQIFHSVECKDAYWNLVRKG